MAAKKKNKDKKSIDYLALVRLDVDRSRQRPLRAPRDGAAAQSLRARIDQGRAPIKARQFTVHGNLSRPAL